MIAPAGSQKGFHPEGELATARAARDRDHLQILSNVSTVSLEDVMAAREAPVWFQLYPTQDFDVATAMVRRAEAAGSPRDAAPPTSRLKKRISFATPTADGSPRWLDRADSPKWLPERMSALAVLGPRLTDDEVRLQPTCNQPLRI